MRSFKFFIIVLSIICNTGTFAGTIMLMGIGGLPISSKDFNSSDFANADFNV